MPKWRLEGLSAAGPARSHRDKLRLFGQFVGDWDMVAWGSPRVTHRPPEKVGEVPFRWVLGGEAIQDVFGGIDPATKRFVAAGTTLRFYDDHLRSWRSTWISASQRVVRRFIGRRVGSEIVLQEENRGLRTERWIFTAIRRNSFRWYAVRRLSPGGPWRQVEEMLLERSS